MLLQLATLFGDKLLAGVGNKALQLAKQQFCATSCKEMLAVLLSLIYLAN